MPQPATVGCFSFTTRLAMVALGATFMSTISGTLSWVIRASRTSPLRTMEHLDRSLTQPYPNLLQSSTTSLKTLRRSLTLPVRFNSQAIVC